MEKKMNRISWVRGSCIGRGAYGTVNLGVDITSGALVAVKSVDLSSGLPSQVRALENEIRILKSLSSPFIVKYLGDDTTLEGFPTTSFRNLHMEYVPSGTAADLATFDEATVASHTWCLVSALSYIHSRGIMHCDVKGKNVLLGPSPGSAKLADFGSAVEISSAAISTRGSPLWMAPEVIRGEYQGPESDVWSLGCTVIEMLTGKPAWPGAANAYAVYRIGYSEDELPLFPAGLSCLCLDFLDKCLRRDCTERWNCDQLMEHPFVSMSWQKNSITYSSPRCVLDWFDLDFHEEEEEEILNLGANDRIRGLVSGGETNWESDGWLVVRGGGLEGGGGGGGGGAGGACSENCDLIGAYQQNLGARLEYSPLIGRTISNSNLSRSLECNDEQCKEPQYFNYNNNVTTGCSRLKRYHQRNNTSFLSDPYIEFPTSFFFLCFSC